MYQSLRGMMAESQSSYTKSCSRLDKYFLLTKIWLDNVVVKDTDAKSILKVLKTNYHSYLITLKLQWIEIFNRSLQVLLQ